MIGCSSKIQEMGHGGFQLVVMTPFFACDWSGDGCVAQFWAKHHWWKSMGHFPSRRKFWFLKPPSCWDAGVQMWYLENMNNEHQFSSVIQSCSTLCDPMDCSTPGFPVQHQFPELTQTHVHRVCDAIQPSYSLSYPSPPAFNLSQHQGLFQWVSSLHQVAKVLEFQLQHQSSNEHSGLISFRMDWLDILAVLGTLKSLLQHYSSKAYKIMNIMSINNSWGCWSGRVERTMLAIAYLSACYYVRKSILTIILGMVFVTAS